VQLASGEVHYFNPLAPGQYGLSAADAFCEPGAVRYTPSTPSVARVVTATESPSVAIFNYATSGATPLATTLSVPTIAGTVGSPINVIPVTASGGTAPYVYTLSGGPLPQGLSFSPVNGQLSGTPAATLPATAFTVTVTDAASGISAKSFTLSVAASGGIVLNVGPSPTENAARGQNITVPILLDLSNRGTDNLAAITVTVRWDASRFSLSNQLPGTWPGGSVITNPTAGQIIISGQSPLGVTTSFTLLSLVLSTSAGAATGSTPITATVSIASGEFGAPISVGVRNLTVTITP
jgi:hypothetical protein